MFSVWCLSLFCFRFVLFFLVNTVKCILKYVSSYFKSWGLADFDKMPMSISEISLQITEGFFPGVCFPPKISRKWLVNDAMLKQHLNVADVYNICTNKFNPFRLWTQPCFTLSTLVRCYKCHATSTPASTPGILFGH